MSKALEVKQELAEFIEGEIVDDDGAILGTKKKDQILNRLTTEEMLPQVLKDLNVGFNEFRKALEGDDEFRQGYQMWQAYKGDKIRITALELAQAEFPEDADLPDKRFMLEHRKLVINQLNVVAKAQDTKVRDMSQKATMFTLNLGFDK